MRDLTKIPTDKLLDKLRKSVDISADQYHEACCIIQELKRRGERVPAFARGDIFRHSREIANGDLSPLAVIICGGHSIAVAALRKLTLKQQERLANGGRIRIGEEGPEGVTTYNRTLPEVSPTDLSVAVTDTGFRSPQEQVEYRKAKARDSASKPKSKGVWVRAEPRTGWLLVGQERVDPVDLVDALKRLGWTLMKDE